MLEINNEEASKKLNGYFNELHRVCEKDGIDGIETFSIIYNAWRTKSILSNYEDVKIAKEDIFRKTSIFLEILNSLFEGRKTFSLTKKNELQIKVGDRVISKEFLSSGEKQMLILLGEAFYRSEESMIYIADEPEISLHIKWQERLVWALSNINKNIQLIFATHSPDIVGGRNKNIIKLGGKNARKF